MRRVGHRDVSKSFATKAEAMAWARSVEGKIAEGQSVPLPQRVTFDDMAERYSVEIAPTAGRSKKQAIAGIRALIGHLRVADMRPTAFVDFVARRERSGAGPSTILMDLSYIGTIIRHASVMFNLDPSSPLQSLAAARAAMAHSGRVGQGARRTRRPEGWELQALKNLWTVERPRRQTPMWHLTLFAIGTAMRLGEITRIEWKDFDEASRTIVIRQRKHPTDKASNDQKVPLLCGHARVLGEVIDPVSIMKELRMPGARVFPHSAHTVSNLFTRACAELGIADLNFHDLRHEGASLLFEAGYSIPEVALVTGHKSWNSLKIYTNLRPEALHR